MTIPRRLFLAGSVALAAFRPRPPKPKPPAPKPRVAAPYSKTYSNTY